jgi:hypothetical protein
MRRRFAQSLRLGVAADALALVETGRWQAPRVLAEQAFGPGAAEAGTLTQALDMLLQAADRAGRPVTIVLADELVRLWSVTPPAGGNSIDDLRAAAGLRFQTLFGEPQAAWQMSADWDADRPFLAAAVKLDLRAQLDTACAAHRMPIVECAPQLVAAINQYRRALRPGAWFGLVHEHLLTIAVIGAGAIQAVRAVALPELADIDWLVHHIEREALRLNLAAPERMQLCGQVPPTWHQQRSVGLLHGALDVAWSGAARLALTGSAA